MRDGDQEETIIQAEKYLINVIKKDSPCKNMDELRYWMYCHSKNKCLEDLPPTSRVTRQHILRALFGTYIQAHCLEENCHQLDPLLFGYTDGGDCLKLNNDFQFYPTDLTEGCKCVK